MSYSQTLPMERRRRPRFGDWPFDRSEAHAAVRLATPIALIALLNMGMSITDTLMAASFGSEALAAVAVGSDYYSIIFYIVAGILGGIAPSYAGALAAADHARILRLRAIGWLLAALGISLAVPAIWLAPDYLSAFGLNEKLLVDGADYTRWMALALIPMTVVALLRHRLTAVQRASILLKVTIVALPLNAGLNHVLMFGFGGWDGIGIAGAGLSSFLVASFIAGTLLLLRDRDGGSCEFARFEWREFSGVLRVGVPIGVTTLSETGVFLGATLYAATMTVDDAAAHAVAIRLAGVFYAVSVALLQASMVRMARIEATGGIGERRTVIASTTTIGALAGIALLTILLLGADGLPRLVLGAGPENLAACALATQLIVFLAVMEFFGPVGSAASGLMRGRNDTRATMLFTLFGNWGLSAPLGIYLSASLGMGITGVWLALALGTIAAALLTIIRLPIHWHNHPAITRSRRRSTLSATMPGAARQPLPVEERN